MDENKIYTVNTLYLVNGDSVDAIQDRFCPLKEQIIYQFENPKREYITIKHEDIGIASVPIKNILYVAANYLSSEELTTYLEKDAKS
ncbi:MAG: hypothetical protein MR458_09685 [Erysipelotrichaceae bacterium]|nr:hypothetical protein [Erysipelotrichaceae bacterium]